MSDDSSQEEFNEFAEQEPRTPGIASRMLRAAIAIAVIVGLLNISGIQQYFFFHQTPPSVVQKEPASAIDAARLTVPLTVFILRSTDSAGSERSLANVRNLIENADRVWEQASIDLRIGAIYDLPMRDREFELLLDNPAAFVQTIDEFDAESLNVFLVGHLRGINGIALGGLQSVAVADYTTVHDFRALAHEIGHILGLSHVAEARSRLMYQGANGFELSLEEIMLARESAESFPL